MTAAAVTYGAGIQVSTLTNGLRVASDPMPGLESTALGVWVAAGARHEAPAECGLSHFLEHMAFKGTSRRTARGIAEEIEAVGGALNAYTDRSQTAYEVRVLKDDLALGLDLLGDILCDPLLAPEDVERERGVILQEIALAKDTPDDLVFDLLQEAAFPDQPMGRPILGTEASVRALTGEGLAGFMRGRYRAPAMVVCAAGAIDHERLVALAQDAFAGLEARAAVPDLPAASPAQFTPQTRLLPQAGEQVHLTLGFEGVSVHSPDYYTAWVFSEILGGGMSSRLFQQVREERGLAYSVYSFDRSYEDTGLIGVYAGVAPGKAGEALALIVSEMLAIVSGVGTAEVARAKALIRAGILMGLETPMGRACDLAEDLIVYGAPVSLSSVLSRLAAVTPQDVCRFAERLLARGRPAYAATGPAGALPTEAALDSLFGAAGGPERR